MKVKKKKNFIFLFLFFFRNEKNWNWIWNDVTQNGADDVKRHRWFKGLDWDEVFYRKLKVNKRPCLSLSRQTNTNTNTPKKLCKIVFFYFLKK
jgi:hypothetical protein